MTSLMRLKLLTRMQTVALLRKKKIDSRNRKIVRAIVYFVTLLLVTFAIYGLFWLLPVLGLKIVDYPLINFVIVFIQVISVIACANGLMNSLFLSNDNPILLAFPATHVEIFVSKLLVYYISEFIRSFSFIVPVLFAFGLNQKYGVLYYLIVMLFSVILPFIPVLIGAVLSYPIMLIKKLFKSKNVLQGIILLLFTSILLFYYVRLLKQIPTPLKILANYGGFTNLINSALSYIYKVSLFYQWVINVIIGKNPLTSFVQLMALMVALLVIVILLTMPTYFSLASHSRESSERKRIKKENKRCSNTFLVFLKKELLISYRNLGKMVNDYIFLFIFPFIFFFIAYVYDAMVLNSLGDNLQIASMVTIGLMLTTSSNVASASAITREGAEFSLLKTAPTKTRNVAWAKITVNLCFSILVISINMILILLFTNLYSDNLIFIWICLVLVNSGHILWSFELDLLHPRLIEFATSGNENENKNISASITIGFIISFMFGLLTLILLMDDYYSGWVRILIIALGFFVARLLMFTKNLKAYFMDIEF